jgi:FG-GAP-like repeat
MIRVRLGLSAVAVCICLTGIPTAQQSGPWKRHTIDASSLGADGVRAADANGDGKLDLVTSWEQGGLTRVYLADRASSGTPWKTITVGKSPDAEDAVFFDADGDGDLDIISSAEGGSRRIQIHWAPSVTSYARESEWRTETLYSDGSQWMFAVPMDVDRQRGRDIIVGGKNERASIGWLESPADPRRVSDWKFHRLSDAGWIMSLIVKDMNRDGLPDVLLSDRFGAMAGVRWLENPGPNSAALNGPWTNHWIGLRERAPMLIDAADLDGDGVEEIVVPHYLKDDFRLSILKRSNANSADTWTEHEIRYPTIAGRPKAVAIGDIDLDGRRDLVLSCEQASNGKRGIIWLRYRESPFHGDWVVFDLSGPEGIKFDLNLLLDVDADGDLDVINSEENDSARDGKPGLGVVWYENPARSRH